jgi:hypothetical protein
MRLALCGDPHGDRGYIQKVFQFAAAQDCEKVIALGDLAWMWPTGRNPRYPKVDRTFRATVRDRIQNTGIPFVFLPGNHDNYDELPDDENAEPVELEPGITYLPRGCRWEWAGQRFAAIGGAYSIDKQGRLEAHAYWNQPLTWWAQEIPAPFVYERVIAGGPLDVLLTHEAPGGYYEPLGHHRNDEHLYREAAFVRSQLRDVVAACRPKILVHGHHHVRYSHDYETGDTPCRWRTKVVGLGANFGPFTDAVTTLTIDDRNLHVHLSGPHA